MIIQVNKTFRIRSDSNNWIVEKVSGFFTNRETEEEEDNWLSILFFSSLEHAMLALFDRGIRDIEGTDVEMIAKKIEHLNRQILKALEPLTNMKQEIAKEARKEGTNRK